MTVQVACTFTGRLAWANHAYRLSPTARNIHHTHFNRNRLALLRGQLNDSLTHERAPAILGQFGEMGAAQYLVAYSRDLVSRHWRAVLFNTLGTLIGDIN